MRLYVASPLGFSEPGRQYWQTFLRPKLISLGFTIVDPWGYLDGLPEAKIRALALSLSTRDAARIGRGNALAIRRADALLAVLDGTDVDGGVAAEVGFAAALQKPIIGYRSDFRPSGDTPKLPVNIQLLSFILGSGGGVYTSWAATQRSLLRLKRSHARSA